MSTAPDMLYHMGGVPVLSSIPTGMPHKVWFVDQRFGSDSYEGDKHNRAKATIQAAVDAANTTAFIQYDQDIYVLSGRYNETVSIIGRTSSSTVGRLRLIGVGNVLLYGGSTSAATTAPTLAVARRYTEIHNFNQIIGLSSSATETFSAPSGSSDANWYMPTVVFDRNPTYATYALANDNVISNCLIDGNNDLGGLAIYGVKRMQIRNCTFINGSDYGLLVAGSTTGACTDVLGSDCLFYGNTYDIRQASTQRAKFVRFQFADDGQTDHLRRVTDGTACSDCVLINCAGQAEDKFEHADNNGWQAIGCYRLDVSGIGSSSDLTGDNWVA